MIAKIIRRFSICFFTLLFFITAGKALHAEDQYGFGDRAFLIQSALETGKSAKGFWDVPGNPRKTNGNLTDLRKVKKWLQIQVWDREKGDPDDRLFSFIPGNGNNAGKYQIKFARERDFGVEYVTGTGTIEVRSGSSYFEFKHLGGDKWKIYVKPGYVLCLEKNTAKNGTKLTLKRDHIGNDAVWVFYDLATLRSYIPPRKAEEVKKPVSAIPEFFINNKEFEYSSQGNMVYYKAKGTAKVKKIEKNIAYVTVNISESEGEGEGGGIVKKGASTFEAKLTRKGDMYYMNEDTNGDMAPSGKVDASGQMLDLYNDGGSSQFKVIK